MSGTTAPAPVATLTPSPLQTFMLRLINESRAAAGTGLRPLVLDAELTVAAQGHAQYMVDADVFSHTGQGGSSPAQRGTAAGYNWTRFGENVAMIAGTGATLNERVVRQMHTNLMESPGHRANLLSAAFTQIGIGLAQGDYRGQPGAFVAQNFAVPTAAELADGTGIAEPPAPVTPGPTPTPPVVPEPGPTPIPTAPTPPAPNAQPVQTARVTLTAGDVVQHLDVTLGGTAPVVAVVPRGS